MNFGKRSSIKKIFCFIMSAIMSCVLIVSDCSSKTSADLVKDLEAKQEQLENEKNKVQENLNEYEGKVEELQEYLDEYDEKMRIQEEQVAVVEQQIKLCQDDITELEAKIQNKQLEVDEGIVIFRQRLRALYISGNDSLASVLAGSADFYDMLARMEFVERVSKHDNDLINNLKTMISELETDKTSLEDKLSTLEQKKLEEEAYYEELRETWNNHHETKEMQQKMVDDYSSRYDEIEAENEKIERQIQDEIRRQQEEAEKRRKAEEERKRLEEEARRLEAEKNGDTYVEQSTEAFTSYSETGFIWPVPTVRNITDKYGERWIVEESRSDFHKGIDITKPGCAGEPIVASAAGEVLTAANTGNGYGYHVIIDHGNKVSTLYGHCSSLAVKAGDIVEQGQVIGYIGSTGYSYGAHLHFEVRVSGQHTDPLNYVNINN